MFTIQKRRFKPAARNSALCSVLNPGTVIGRNSNIYPLSRVRGVIPANHIFKDKDNVVLKK